MVRGFRSIAGNAFEWERLTPNEHGDWISMRNDSFSSLIPLGPEKKFKADSKKCVLDLFAWNWNQ